MAEAAIGGGAVAVGEAAEVDAASVGPSLSAQAERIAFQAGLGNATNAGVTVTLDAANGRTPTVEELGNSILIGALSGGLAEFFTGPGVGLNGGLARTALGYIGAGSVGTLTNATISRWELGATGEQSVKSSFGQLMDAELKHSPPLLLSSIDSGFGILSGVF